MKDCLLGIRFPFSVVAGLHILEYNAAGLGFLTEVVDDCGVWLPKPLKALALRRRDISAGESRECVTFGLSSCCCEKFVRVHDR